VDKDIHCFSWFVKQCTRYLLLQTGEDLLHVPSSWHSL